MKINYKKSNSTVYFKDINIGECFKLRSRDHIFLKVAENDLGGHSRWGCCLATGILYDFIGDAEVQQVEAEILVDTEES